MTTIRRNEEGMTAGSVNLYVEKRDSGKALIWHVGGRAVLALPSAAMVEVADPAGMTVAGARHALPYASVTREGDRLVATAEITTPEARFAFTDVWRRVSDDTWRVDRVLRTLAADPSVGVRLVLDLVPVIPRRAYGDLRYFAPPAVYDLNDLNDDGIEEYLEIKYVMMAGI